MKKIFRDGILISKAQNCKKCQNFYIEDEEKCFIYGNPNYNISICHDFKLLKNWGKKMRDILTFIFIFIFLCIGLLGFIYSIKGV